MSGGSGEIVYMSALIDWHTVANPTRERAVSHHLYSGPIDSCSYFDPNSRTIKLRQMTYFSVDGVVQQPPRPSRTEPRKIQVLDRL